MGNISRNTFFSNIRLRVQCTIKVTINLDTLSVLSAIKSFFKKIETKLTNKIFLGKHLFKLVIIAAKNICVFPKRNLHSTIKQ